MTFERTINIEGTKYSLILSDEPQTLLTAKAAGRVVVGIGHPASDEEKGCSEGNYSEDSGSWLPADYVTYSLPADEKWLNGVARRELGIPWNIAVTKRLIIREFSPADITSIPHDADDSPDEAILKDPERLQRYIDEQYKFFDCGMWALVRKEDGKIVGMVSLTPSSFPDAENTCEIGYHIYTAYRRRGYAMEAVKRLTELLSERRINAVAYTEPENAASVNLLKKLGFKKILSPDPEKGLPDCFLRPFFV